MKKLISITLIIAMMLSFAACGSKEPEKTAVNVFAAASLSGVMAEFEAEFEKANPDVDIVINADSS